MGFYFLLALLACLLYSLDGASAVVPTPELRKALLDLYTSTNGGSWNVDTNWNTDKDLCTWYGIKCLVHQHNVTTEINLPGNNLKGSIPSSIGTFIDLKKLDLSNNGLTGPIPATINQLPVLQFLYLQQNLLTGPLPAEIYNIKNATFPVGTELRELNLQNNSLDGMIPNSWFGPDQTQPFSPPVNLQVINMRYNRLTGSIPANISHAHKLTTLLLSYNQLSGDIEGDKVLDSWLGTRKYCDLNGNHFTGDLPAAVKKACFP